MVKGRVIKGTKILAESNHGTKTRHRNQTHTTKNKNNTYKETTLNSYFSIFQIVLLLDSGCPQVTSLS